MNNIFLHIRIFFRNLYSGKTKSYNNNDNDNNDNEAIISSAQQKSSLASLSASNKIYEEDDLLVNDVNFDSKLDAEFGLRIEPCKCRVCYVVKNIFRIHSYKCANERKRVFLEDI